MNESIFTLFFILKRRLVAKDSSFRELLTLLYVEIPSLNAFCIQSDDTFKTVQECQCTWYHTSAFAGGGVMKSDGYQNGQSAWRDEFNGSRRVLYIRDEQIS